MEEWGGGEGVRCDVDDCYDDGLEVGVGGLLFQLFGLLKPLLIRTSMASSPLMDVLYD